MARAKTHSIAAAEVMPDIENDEGSVLRALLDMESTIRQVRWAVSTITLLAEGISARSAHSSEAPNRTTVADTLHLIADKLDLTTDVLTSEWTVAVEHEQSRRRIPPPSYVGNAERQEIFNFIAGWAKANKISKHDAATLEADIWDLAQRASGKVDS